MLSNRKGFTLIELLIVVVIIGILAAIAIPKFAATKDKAKLASVKTDLRNLMTTQEAYFSDNQAYATSLAAVQGAGYNYSLSAGNTLSGVAAVGGSWTATVSNSTIAASGIKQCLVNVGTGITTGTTADGVIACTT
jgi:prepilin-type N-terminal cleavage/methylation domain-containing protein